MKTNLERITKVGMGQKIAFGFGMLANQMFPAALGFLLLFLFKILVLLLFYGE